MSRITENTAINIDLRKTLLAGPWVSELGTELFCWQGYIRSIAYRYSKIIIIGRSGHKILYEDFCDDYIEYNPPKDGSQAIEIYKRKFYRNIIDLVKTIPHDVWLKPYPIGHGNVDRNIDMPEFTGQKFITYQSDSLDKKYDIIIHARNKSIDNHRNWNKKKWQTLINLLIKDFTVASIGGEESYTFDDVENYKNLPLNDVVSLMNRCKLIVGPISGPIHLAALSNTKQLIWAANAEIINCDYRWNPFAVSCFFMIEEDYNPDPDNVYAYIKTAINEK